MRLGVKCMLCRNLEEVGRPRGLVACSRCRAGPAGSPPLPRCPRLVDQPAIPVHRLVPAPAVPAQSTPPNAVPAASHCAPAVPSASCLPTLPLQTRSAPGFAIQALAWLPLRRTIHPRRSGTWLRQHHLRGQVIRPLAPRNAALGRRQNDEFRVRCQQVESLRAARQLPPAARVSRITLLADGTPQRPAARRTLGTQDGDNPIDGLGRAQ